MLNGQPSAFIPAAAICSSSCDCTPEIPTAPTQVPSTTIGRPPCTGVTPGIFSIAMRPPLTRSSHIAVERRVIRFEVAAFEGARKLGEGHHARGVIDVAKFNKRLGAK